MTHSLNGDQRQARLVAAYNAGEDLDKVAAEHGITTAYLYHLIRDDPARITAKQRTAVRRSTAAVEVARLYQAGESIRQIAKRQARSYGGVRNLLIFAGVELRPRGRAAIQAERAVALAATNDAVTDMARTAQFSAQGPDGGGVASGS